MTKLPNIGKPATNALQLLDITTLEQVAEYDEKTLLKIHGVGPKAIGILKEALAGSGLALKQTTKGTAPSGVGFAVLCDFDCDNAPKKRMIRDYLVASASGDRATLESVLEESFVWTVPGEFQIKGRDAFIAELIANLQAVNILEVQSLISHGKEGSAHGTVINKKGKHVYFSDIFTFQSNKPDAKISKLTSFVVIEE